MSLLKRLKKQRDINKCLKIMENTLLQYYDSKESFIMKVSDCFNTDTIMGAIYRLSLRYDLTIVFRNKEYVNEFIEHEDFYARVIAYENCNAVSNRRYLLLPFTFTDTLFDEVVEDKDNQYILIA